MKGLPNSVYTVQAFACNYVALRLKCMCVLHTMHMLQMPAHIHVHTLAKNKKQVYSVKSWNFQTNHIANKYVITQRSKFSLKPS